METPNKKLTLEIYGLIRMVFGVALLVGLSCGYFVKEWILRHPMGTSQYIIDQEIVVLALLAVFLRGVFHMMAGMGIARIKSFGRNIILFGWPILVVITTGLVFALFQDWKNEGMVVHFSEIISWPRLISYLFLVLADYFFVCRWIVDVNENWDMLDEANRRIDGRKVAAMFFMTVLGLSVLLYLGRPIRQGFHKGFYKNSVSVTRKKTSSQKSQNQKVRILKPDGPTSTSAGKVPKVKKVNPSYSTKKKEKPLGIAKVSLVTVQKKSDQQGRKVTKRVESTRRKPVESGLAYVTLFGFLGGFCLLTGLFLQLFKIQQFQEAKSISLSAYVLLSVGFFMWIIYGLSVKLVPLSLTGFVAFLLCLGVILMKFNYDS